MGKLLTSSEKKQILMSSVDWSILTVTIECRQFWFTLGEGQFVLLATRRDVGMSRRLMAGRMKRKS